jgi:hypothetical protein
MGPGKGQGRVKDDVGGIEADLEVVPGKNTTNASNSSSRAREVKVVHGQPTRTHAPRSFEKRLRMRPCMVGGWVGG